MEIPKGWGELKGRNFRGVWGVPTRSLLYFIIDFLLSTVEGKLFVEQSSRQINFCQKM